VTGDSLTPEQPPSGPLYARQSDETPTVGTRRGAGGTSGPQTGTEGLEAERRRHALAFNAVAPALKAHDQWLPLSVRKAVAEAVLAVADREQQHLLGLLGEAVDWIHEGELRDRITAALNPQEQP
jgi:hypothetical protein